MSDELDPESGAETERLSGGEPVTLAELDALAATWPACDYYSLDDGPDELAYTTVVRALGLDDLRDPDHFMSWLLRWKAAGALPVYGWTRKTVSGSDIDSMIEALTVAFHEHWRDALELGNPEGDDSDDEPEWLRAAVTADMTKRRVWACDLTHTFWLTPETVIAIARRERAELVDDEGAR